MNERKYLFCQRIVTYDRDRALGEYEIQWYTCNICDYQDTQYGESFLDEGHISDDIVPIEGIIRDEWEQGSSVGAADEYEQYDGESYFEAHRIRVRD